MASSDLKCLDVSGSATATARTGGNSSWDTTNGYSQPSGSGGNIPTAGWLSAVPNVVDSSPGSIAPVITSRTGAVVIAEELNVTVNIVPDVDGAGFGDLRILIVVDNESDGAYPDVADVLAEIGPSGAISVNTRPECRLNPAYFARFHVLKDHFQQWTNQVYWNGSTAVNHGIMCDQPWVHHWDLTSRLKSNPAGNKVRFNPGTNTTLIGDARPGHIFMYAFWARRSISAGVVSQASTNPPAVMVESRLRFRDCPT